MGGTELHTRKLANALSIDHNICVVTQCSTSENSSISLEQDANRGLNRSFFDGSVAVHQICSEISAKPLLRKLAKHHRRYKIARMLYSAVFCRSLYKRSSNIAVGADVIHFIYNGLTDSAMLAATIAKKRNIPFVLTPNILDTTNSKNAWNSMRFKYLYKAASKIIALTLHEAQWLVDQGVPRSKISVVPYGPILEEIPDANQFRQSKDMGDAKIVLFLSRIIPLKGYKLVLDACHDIWSKHPDTRIVFMGPTTPESKKSILEFGDSRISLLENFNQQTKANALAACDLLCVPSRKESLGVVYIEAAFNGKPVVGLDIPVLHEVIEHGKDGLLVDESAQSVGEAVISLLSNPETSRAMGEAGKAKAMEKFDWPKVKANISDIYKDAIATYTNQQSSTLLSKQIPLSPNATSIESK
jgi:glycosyltransferase involved in cell wall biosynthesis